MSRLETGLTSCLVGLLAAATVSPLEAAIIDFETTPSATVPVDDSFVGPYPLAGGGNVTFFFDVNGNLAFDGGVDQRPVFEAAGNADPNGGFVNNSTGIDDTANGGLASQLGSYFIRQLQPGSVPPPFIVDYNTATTISGLSGEIWDIDGLPGNNEQWLVEALDASNSLITSQFSPPGISAALDGLPWVFSFSGLPAGFDKLRITFTGLKTSGLGLAFNNFDPFNPVPEPSSLALFMIGCAWLAVHSRRLAAQRVRLRST